MRKFVTLSLAAAALAAAGGVAYAQAGPRAERPAAPTRAEAEQRSAAGFARMDANGDGVLDRSDRRKVAFERLDADRDGALSLEEFSAVRERRGQRLATRGRGADTNRDGSVTRAEFTSAALARFDRVDIDKDGTISDSERPARRTMRRERRQRGAG